jgi:hypothetical protein
MAFDFKKEYKTLYAPTTKLTSAHSSIPSRKNFSRRCPKPLKVRNSATN